MPPRAPARPTRRGSDRSWSGSETTRPAAAGRRRAEGAGEALGGPAPPCPLGHAPPCPRRRHRGRPPRPDRGPRASLDGRVAHRRHPGPHPGAPARSPPDRSRHHPGKPVAAAHARGRAGPVRPSRAGRSRRVARAARVQARSADRARARAAPPLSPRSPHARALRHPRQSRRGPRCAARPRSEWGAAIRQDRPRAGAQGARGRCPDSRDDGAVSLVRADRAPAPARSGRGDRGGRDLARLHEHPRDRRDLVSGAARGSSRLGGDHGAAPRLARPQDPRMGGGRTPRRQAALRRLYVHPRPRRGLHAGGPRAPGRQPQERRSAAFSARAGAGTSRAPSAA